MTNDNVVEMVEAKVPVNLILTQIRTSKTNFDLSASEVIRLTKAGVPAVVIDAMRDPTKVPGTDGPDPRATSETAEDPRPAGPVGYQLRHRCRLPPRRLHPRSL